MSACPKSCRAFALRILALPWASVVRFAVFGPGVGRGGAGGGGGGVGIRVYRV